MPLIIPDELKQVLFSLFDLPAPQRSKLSEALRSIKPVFSAKAAASQIHSMADEIEQSKLEDIISAIISLYSALDRTNLTPKELAAEITSFLSSNEQPEKYKSAEDITIFRDFLAEVLSLDNTLAITAKAFDVIIQHENPLRSVRILSDLRPIFSTDKDPKMAAGMVVHNLKLTVGLSGEPTSMFVALDARDIRNLRAEIDRAIRKESEIKELARKGSLCYIDID
jgi:hypothetical protein